MIELSFNKANFEDNGFTIIRGVFTHDNLFLFKKTLQNIVRLFVMKASKEHPELASIKNTMDCDEGILALRDLAPTYISHIQRTISRSPEFYRLLSNPQLPLIFNELLDSQDLPLYFSNNGVLFTLPYAGSDNRSINVELDWHNDVFYTVPRSQYLQIWAPLLHDSTKEIGTLMVCPGSQREGLLPQKINVDVPYNHRYTAVSGIADFFNPISIEMQLGDLLVFHHHLLHKSGRNITDLVRCSLIGLCHNAATEAFYPFATEYKYPKETPEGYFYECFGDETAKSVMYEQAASPGEPKSGA